MEVVTLKTGVKMQYPMAIAFRSVISGLVEEKFGLFLSLLSLWRDPKKEISEDHIQLLHKYKLLESDGSLQEDLRLFLDASLIPTDDFFAFQDPILPQLVEERMARTKDAQLNDKVLFQQVQRIAQIIFDTVQEVSNFVEDRRKDGPNPFYGQTSSGLFLEYYYSTPSGLWTPWGKLMVTGSVGGCMGGERSFSELHQALGAEMYKECESTTMGPVGPVYALTLCEKDVLPPAVALHRSGFDPYELCNEAWGELLHQE